MYDSYKRRISYLRIAVTDRCNLRCLYCMPEEGIALKEHNDILSYERIVEIVRAAVPLGIVKIRLTGGEPLVRRGIFQLVRELKSIPGLHEVAMTSNGVLLADMAAELKKCGLDRLNISLDTLDREKYRRITRIGELERVLAGIERAAEVGFTGTKINMVLIPGFNEDEVQGMMAFCRARGMQLQRINHYHLDHPLQASLLLPAERPLSCHLCNRIRLTADGQLKPCLFSDLELPMDFSDIAASIRAAISRKPWSGSVCTSRQNWQIGG